MIFSTFVGMFPFRLTPSEYALNPFVSASFSAPVHRLAGQGQELLACLAGEPAGEGQGGLVRLALELGAVERPDDGVGVTGRLAGVDDEARLGAAAGGLLELVRPAAVVGQRLAAEQFRVVRRRLVGEQHDDLALHVHALVIVPLELRRGDAVAEEDRLGVELFPFRLRLAPAGEALLAGDVQLGLALDRLERRFRARDDAQQRHGLEVRAAVADRLEAGLLELVREILGGQLLAARSGAAPFQAVARQVHDVGLDPVGGNRRGLVGSAPRDADTSKAATRSENDL